MRKPRAWRCNHCRGIVVDDDAAKLTGKWTVGAGLTPFIGDGYRYAQAKEEATARYELTVPEAGKYELRLAWMGHENRASKHPARSSAPASGRSSCGSTSVKTPTTSKGSTRWANSTSPPERPR